MSKITEIIDSYRDIYTLTTEAPVAQAPVAPPPAAGVDPYAAAPPVAPIPGGETPADPGQDVTEPEEPTQMTSEGKKFLISLGLKALRIDADLLSEDDLFKAADDVNDDNAEEMLDFLMNTVEEHK